MPGWLAQIQGSRSHARQCSLAPLLRIPSVESSLLSDYMESLWAALPQPRGFAASQQTLKYRTVASFLRHSERGPEWLSNWRSFSWCWNHSLKSQVTPTPPRGVCSDFLEPLGQCRGRAQPPSSCWTDRGWAVFLCQFHAGFPAFPLCLNEVRVPRHFLLSAAFMQFRERRC